MILVTKTKVPVEFWRHPTPFKSDNEVGLSNFEAALHGIEAQQVGDELIIREPTSPPSATLHFAQAHEPVLPRSITVKMTSTRQGIGDLTLETGAKAREVYETFRDGEVPATDTMTAEIVKRAKNDLRDASIELGNELSSITDPFTQVRPGALAGVGNVQLVNTKEAIMASRVVSLLVDHDHCRTVDSSTLEGRLIVDTQSSERA